MAENKDQQNQGAQQGNINEDRDMGKEQQGIGQKSDYGSTSTDPEKARLQTVKGSEMADEDNTDRYSTGAGDMAENKTGQGVTNNSDVDSGFIRTAAFDKENTDNKRQDKNNEKA